MSRGISLLLLLLLVLSVQAPGPMPRKKPLSEESPHVIAAALQQHIASQKEVSKEREKRWYVVFLPEGEQELVEGTGMNTAAGGALCILHGKGDTPTLYAPWAWRKAGRMGRDD